MITVAEALTLLIAGTAIIVSIRGHIHARRSADMAEKSYNYSRVNSKAELFSSLRTTYLTVHLNFPKSKKYDYQDFKSAFWSYWLNAYNEWYITRHICPGYALWEEFYRDAIRGALANDSLRRALTEMIAAGYAFGAHELREKFIHDIEYFPPSEPTQTQ
ncbi:hypothetical protein H3222_18655 [Pseudomonas chengduensis]|jgi:hypothetical protein|nr:hypothetical protein [Pseudomonas chengduensis]MBG0847228.1 hypothetical protein [Pseudomonas chengduensis]